jgi:hypothetical protein
MTTELAGPDRIPYVVFGGRSVDWAVRADLVQQIVSEADWKGAAPVDVAALWGEQLIAEAAPSRVLVVQTAKGVRGIRAERITYRTVAGLDLSVLPRVMARTRAATFVTGIVFEDPHPTLVVLNPEGLSPDGPG